MPRLIDADGAIQKVDEAFAQYADHGYVLKLFSDVRMAVLFAPTIDAVSVVRCWYCKNVLLSSTGHHRCCQFEIPVKEDDYCSFGERRDA